MAQLKQDKVRANPATPARMVPRRRGKLAIAKTVRRQTADQRHNFTAALDDVLAELVRQHLGRKGN